MIKVTLNKGSQKVMVELIDIEKPHNRAIRKTLYEIGKDNVRHLRKMLRTGPRTGRIYTINGRRHQASAAGEPPAKLSGDLARSVNYKVRGKASNKGSYEMEFGEGNKDTLKYGKWLEKGTENEDGSVKMDARPHISVTVEDKQKDVEVAFLQNIKQQIGSR